VVAGGSEARRVSYFLFRIESMSSMYGVVEMNKEEKSE
jgi:hypothetical protein